MDPFHRGMTRYPVANEGDGTQIRRIAGNTLNKQPRTADDGWSSSFGVGRGAKTPHRKKVCCEVLHRTSQSDVFFGTSKATENGYEIWNTEC
jgi:hypothetical protein